MAIPSVLILRGPGTNCDHEAAFACERAGAAVSKIHINRLRESPDELRNHQMLLLPGGFSYGDDVAAGKILAIQLEHFLADAIREFRDQDKLILGICNGFQTLLKSGLIVPPDEDGPLATLAHNTSGRYEDRWVRLLASPGRSVFLRGLTTLEAPVAHGEGKLVCRKEWILQGLAQAGQAVLHYVGPNGEPPEYPHNPNGSQGDIAGLGDSTGRVLGLMPHPERNVLPTHHPRWTRTGLKPEGDGFGIFRNAVEYFK
jgi:phosphoribosylformylglycinamidine synthase subunit PurQ / glutaminase